MDSTNNEENNKNITTENNNSDVAFKKPILIGKIGKLPRKVEQKPSNNVESNNSNIEIEAIEIKTDETVVVENNILPEPAPRQSLPYKEPSWSGLPQSDGKDYILEVLKNGRIIETINLMSKPFWSFGRFTNCDICMQHATISRYHAVLQFRREANDTENPGLYIYDLDSTHGTFLNKKRIRSRIYVRIQVGHMLKLGCSSRHFILNGPESDAEEESDLTVTELKQKRAEEIRLWEEQRKEAALKAEKEEEERKKREEERGIDWGLGDDADEDDDVSENPYAQTNNEELYLDDPKKALRGFFEREGLELEYDCTEQGLGQFICKVELPVDDELGRPIMAQVLHKGKKKEAVVQCALEACRILDRYGVLRQATHESRKRKVKNWEENDYYDSDDDTFLDRTGTIEMKREMRMKAKLPQKVETYESLLEKEKTLSESITNIEKQLMDAQRNLTEQSNSNAEDDSLDNFMKQLKQSKLDKSTISKLKMELAKSKQEHAKIVKLANIAKPVDLPALIPNISEPSTSQSSSSKSTKLPLYGKRLKVKVNLPPKTTPVINNQMEDDEIEEEDVNEVVQTNQTPSNEEIQESNINSSEVNEDQSNPIEDQEMTIIKFEKLLQKGLPPFADKHQEKLEKILNTIKQMATNEDRMHSNWKIITAKKRKVKKLFSDLRNCEPNEKLEHQVSSELSRILEELNELNEMKQKVLGKVRKMGHAIKSISEAMNEEELKPTTSSGESSVDDKKIKKNQRRIQQRQERAEIERQRGYEEDAAREDYNMWVPPNDQSGDGRTSLNDKLGY